MSATNMNHDATDIDRLHSAVKREKVDLPAGTEPAPMWALFIGFIVAILAGSHLGMMSNVFSIESKPSFAPVGDPRPSSGGGAEALDPFALAMKKGAASYAVCAGCHQGTGMGVPGQFPPLAGSEYVKGGTERLVRIVLSGLQGPISVKGTAFNTPGGMPPQGLTFSDGDLANVLTYIRNSFGNEGPMVTKEMVAKVRSSISGHSAQWTDAELKEFADKNCPGDVPAGPGASPAPAAK